MFWFLLGLFIGACLGWIACAIVSVGMLADRED